MSGTLPLDPKGAAPLDSHFRLTFRSLHAPHVSPSASLRNNFWTVRNLGILHNAVGRCCNIWDTCCYYATFCSPWWRVTVTRKKQSSIEDRGQTDRVTALTLTYVLDFQSQVSYGHDPYTHTQKLKFKGESVQKIEWKRTDRRTDGRTDGQTDCSTFPAKAVANNMTWIITYRDATDERTCVIISVLKVSYN